MNTVTVESPFAANETNSEAVHRAYLERCILDCIKRGESPYASHKMLTDALDDSIPEQRTTGIEAGYIYAARSDKIAFYIDYGTSHGMKLAENKYKLFSLPYEFREIGKNP